MTEGQKCLETARENLARFEKLAPSLESQRFLSEALIDLQDLIEGESPQEEKEVGKAIVNTYAARVLATVRGLLTDQSSPGASELRGWENVMDVFSDSGFEVSKEFRDAQVDLMLKELKTRMESLSPKQRMQLGLFLASSKRMAEQ